ncbi:MAG: phosphoglycolate phosphatase [Paracoccus sp. (in: a-proteobacteria)]
MTDTPVPIVFDLDGTLIDSAPDIHACVNAVLRDNQIPPLTLPRVRSFIGGGVELLWTRVIAACGIDPVHRGTLIAAFMSRYHDATALTRLYPGAAEALAVLAELGHPLGMCTNKPLGPTRHILEHFGLTRCFGVVIAGDSLPEKKPHPAPLRAALAALGADGALPRGLYVGDSEFDANCAKAVPVPFLLYTEGYRHVALDEMTSHARFSHFDDLPRLVTEAAEVLPAA